MVLKAPSLNQCPVCFSDQLALVIQFKNTPIFFNVLWPNRTDALQVPRGDIVLCFCQKCGHIFNQAYEPEKLDYDLNYENSLHFSPHFQGYVTNLAARLIEKYRLTGKHLIEIGAGQGDFLKLLCEKGGNRGVGFDPSYHAEPGMEQNGVTILRDYYSEKYANFPADFICCRQVLEHIPQPTRFIQMLRRVIHQRTETIVFFEVPNAAFTISRLGIWDILYEHFSYFHRSSLIQVFAQNGFQVIDVAPTFGDQFLTIEAKPLPGFPPAAISDQDLYQYTQDVLRFAENFRSKINFWQQRLDQLRVERKTAVVWGAGTKGISFLNNLATEDVIPYVVDINPRKEGMHITGTGHKIMPPEFLKMSPPDIVIIMNANYQAEIRQKLDQIGISAQIMTA